MYVCTMSLLGAHRARTKCYRWVWVPWCGCWVQPVSCKSSQWTLLSHLCSSKLAILKKGNKNNRRISWVRESWTIWNTSLKAWLEVQGGEQPLRMILLDWGRRSSSTDVALGIICAMWTRKKGHWPSRPEQSHKAWPPSDWWIPQSYLPHIR